MKEDDCPSLCYSQVPLHCAGAASGQWCPQGLGVAEAQPDRVGGRLRNASQPHQFWESEVLSKEPSLTHTPKKHLGIYQERLPSMENHRQNATTNHSLNSSPFSSVMHGEGGKSEQSVRHQAHLPSPQQPLRNPLNRTDVSQADCLSSKCGSQQREDMSGLWDARAASPRLPGCCMWLHLSVLWRPSWPSLACLCTRLC